MSSILTALKKLENESAHQKVAQSGSWRRGIKPSSPMGTGMSRIYKGLIFIFAIIGIVSVAEWFTIDKRPLSIVPHAENSEIKKNDENAKPLVSTFDQAKTKGLLNSPVYKPLEITSQKETVRADRSVPMARDTIPGASIFHPPIDPHGQPGKPSVPEIKDSTPVPASITEWENGNRLKLQAIGWFSTPEKRIAVINSRVVREGDMIDGIKIVTISEDQVILSEREQLYKLLFHFN